MLRLDYAAVVSVQTVDWTARPGTTKVEGLRERKKRQLRQQLTDTATAMFLERGFESVRVAEIADACGVSEKTVFNYFPTKESLVLDHSDAVLSALRAGLADRDVTPVDAALRILAGELDAMTSWLESLDDPAEAGAGIGRFNTMIETTPALRAHQRDMDDQLATVATEVLAERAGLGADDPEPRIAAIAVLGLWRIQFASLRRHLDGTRTPAQVRQAVTADVRAAARLIDAGLGDFPPAKRVAVKRAASSQSRTARQRGPR